MPRHPEKKSPSGLFRRTALVLVLAGTCSLPFACGGPTSTREKTNTPAPSATQSASILEVTSSSQIDHAIAKARASPDTYVVWLNGDIFTHSGALTIPDDVHIRGNGIYDQGVAGGGGGTWLQCPLRWGSGSLIENVLVGKNEPAGACQFYPVARGSSAAGADTEANGCHDTRFSFVRFKGGDDGGGALIDLGGNFSRGWDASTNPPRKTDMVRNVFDDCEFERPQGPGSSSFTSGMAGPILNIWWDCRTGGAKVYGNHWNRCHFGVKNGYRSGAAGYGIGQVVIFQGGPTTPDSAGAGDPDCGPRVGGDVVFGAGSNIDMTSWNPSFNWDKVNHMAYDNWFTDCLFEYSLWYPMNLTDLSRAYSMWMGCKQGGDPNYDGWGNPTGQQWVNIPESIWTHGFHIVRCYHKGRVTGSGSNVCEQVRDSYAVDSTNASGSFMINGRFGCSQTGSFSNANRPHTAIFPASAESDWTGSGPRYTPSPYDP